MINAYWLAVIAMLFWGIAPIFAKLGLGSIQPLAALTIRSLIICAILLITITISGQWSSITGAAPKDVGFIAFEGICAALFAQLAYYYALKYGDVGRISPIAAAFPLVAVFLGIVFLGEKLTLYKAIAALLIVSGIMLLKL